MTHTNFMYMFLVTLIVSGCSLFSATTPPPSASNWTTITLTQSGGFIGISQSIEISHAGKFVVTDDRTGQSIHGELSPKELSALNDLIASAESIPAATPKQTGCADCFEYALQIQNGGNNPSVQFDDVSLPESGYEPLVTYLREVMDKALK